MIWWMLILIWLVGISVFLVLASDFRVTPWYWIGCCVVADYASGSERSDLEAELSWMTL